MRFRLISLILAIGALSSGGHAADLTMVTRSETGRAIARLATQGLGYSVLHDVPGIPQRSYRVHVTCTITERFAQTYCPTPQYEAYCPGAKIVCR
jgi:hypothetical protein